MNPTPVLQFQDVTVTGGHPYDSGLYLVNFTINEGDFMLLRLGNSQSCLPLADAAEGMLDPEEGAVHFLGRDWSDLSPDEATECRGNIGRVHDGHGWISDLSVEKNITLAQRHNTNRPEAEIREEAAALARVFSLPGLPQGMTSTLRRQDLQRAACVRAFLGKPRLLILEEPTAGVYPQIMSPLMASIRIARARGAAVLWTTADSQVWNDSGIHATIRGTMTGSQMRISPGAK